MRLQAFKDRMNAVVNNAVDMKALFNLQTRVSGRVVQLLESWQVGMADMVKPSGLLWEEKLSNTW